MTVVNSYDIVTKNVNRFRAVDWDIPLRRKGVEANAPEKEGEARLDTSRIL